MVNAGVISGLKADLEAEARRLGFVGFGIAPAREDAVAAARLDAWLGEGSHGEMAWMQTRAHHRRSPQGLWPEAQSVIALGMSYAPANDPLALAGHGKVGRISAYAQGADYHDVVKKDRKSVV